MRIVQVNTVETGANGITNVMLGYCTAILKLAKDIRFDLVCINEPEEKYTRPFLESGGKVYVLSRLKHPLEYRKQLGKIFRGADAVHAHGNSATLALEMEAAFNAGVPLRIAHSHNTDQLDNPKGLKDHLHRAYLKYEKHLLRRYAEYYVACSPEAGKWLFGKKRCKGENYLLLTNAIESSRYSYDEETRAEVRKELGFEGKKVIIHVGQFRTQKNHDKVIEIFSELCSRDEAYRLILVGKGEDEYRIRDKVSSMGLSGKVRFLGNRNDVDRLLQAADVFLFPSLYEGLSIALLEAQASDLICIVSDTVSPSSFVTEKAVSLGLDKDAKTWADKIEASLDAFKTRSDRKSLFTDKGYDISAQIKVLEKFYMKAAGI